MRLAPLPALAFAALPAWAEPPQVVTDIAPVQSLVAAVMDGVGDPALILEGGGDPHNVNLRPSQARAISDADLVIWVGPALTPWLEDALPRLAPETAVLTLSDLEGLEVIEIGEDGHGMEADHDDHGDEDHAEDDDHDHDDHAEEAGHDDHDHESGDDHAEEADHAHSHAGGIDPHLWLSVENAALWADVIAETLGEADAENAATYRANAAALIAEIAATDANVRARLAPHAGQPYFTDHDALAYVARHYDLTVIAAPGAHEAVRLSASDIGDLRARIAEAGARCLVTGPAGDEGLAAVLSDAPVVHVRIDPLGTVGMDYPTLIEGIGASLETCLSGAS